MKVVITDYEYEGLDQERAIVAGMGAELEAFQCKTESELIETVIPSQPDGLICQYARISREVIERLERCRVIVRYAVGYDTIDLQAATERGIYVCNVPDYGSQEVSTHTFALILALTRKIYQYDQGVRSGRWHYCHGKPIHRMSNLTLGLLGFGRIPRLVAKKADAFGMRTVVHDPYLSNNEIENMGYEPAPFGELLAISNVISIHAPLTEETRHLFDRAAFSRMQQHPYVVNTARGALIDEQALIGALDSGQVTAVALDVSETEPVPTDSPLLGRDDVLITPHTAWYSEESIRVLQRSVAEEVVRVLGGQSPKNPVNTVSR
jgi:D-3-phosphoglycerate dehydrogenase / 2-oxoglutarate reductase